jgi:hypothetical protein
MCDSVRIQSTVERLCFRGLGMGKQTVVQLAKSSAWIAAIAFVWMRFGAFAVLFYLTILFVIRSVIVALQTMHDSEGPISAIFAGMIRYPNAENAWERIRFQVADWLNWFSLELCPPVKTYVIVRKIIRVKKEPSTSELLITNEPEALYPLLYWIYRAVVAIIIFLCIGRPSIYGTLFISTVLASSFSEDLALSISPDGLLASLKATEGSVLLKLIAVTVLDIVALTFCIGALHMSMRGHGLQLKDVLPLARELVSAPKTLVSTFGTNPKSYYATFRAMPAPEMLVWFLVFRSMAPF